jgi:hypothetical protein
MTTEERPLSEILAALNERAKELNCLYRVDDVLGRRDITTADALREIVDVLPPGWQYPEICQARIEHAGEAYSTPGYRETEWLQGRSGSGTRRRGRRGTRGRSWRRSAVSSPRSPSGSGSSWSRGRKGRASRRRRLPDAPGP